jgi:hypothetical protein
MTKRVGWGRLLKHLLRQSYSSPLVLLTIMLNYNTSRIASPSCTRGERLTGSLVGVVVGSHTDSILCGVSYERYIRSS